MSSVSCAPLSVRDGVLMKNAADQKNSYFHLTFYFALVNQVLAGEGLGGMI